MFAETFNYTTKFCLNGLSFLHLPDLILLFKNSIHHLMTIDEYYALHRVHCHGCDL